MPNTAAASLRTNFYTIVQMEFPINIMSLWDIPHNIKCHLIAKYQEHVRHFKTLNTNMNKLNINVTVTKSLSYSKFIDFQMPNKSLTKSIKNQSASQQAIWFIRFDYHVLFYYVMWYITYKQRHSCKEFVKIWFKISVWMKYKSFHKIMELWQYFFIWCIEMISRF